MIIERDYGDHTYESQTFTVDPELKITYNDLSISGDEGLPQDKTEEEIKLSYGDDTE